MLISGLHDRILKIMRSSEPLKKISRNLKEKKKTDPKKTDDENLQGLDGKSKGKGKEKGKGKGKDKNHDQTSPTKPGADQERTRQKRTDIIPLDKQPASWFAEINPNDNFPRGLCTGFVLTGKCPHTERGDTCYFGLHGGHPANITPEMRKACEARKAAREARKTAWNSFRSQLKGKGKGKSNAQSLSADAELKRALDAQKDQ